MDDFITLHYIVMLLNSSLISRLLNENRPDFKTFYKHSDYDIFIQSFNKKIFEQRIDIVYMFLKYGTDMNVYDEGFTSL